MLDASLHLLKRAGGVGRDMVHTYMADNAKYVVKHKALVASLTLRTHDAYTKLQTLEIHTRFLDLEQKAASGASRDMLLDNIQAMMEAFPWATGKEGLKTIPEMSFFMETRDKRRRAASARSSTSGDRHRTRCPTGNQGPEVPRTKLNIVLDTATVTTIITCEF